MTVTFDKTMEVFSVDKFSKNRDEFFSNFSPKFYQQENFAPINQTQPRKSVTFQEAMKCTLITGQFFGLNPVIGVTEIDTSKLRFSLFSSRCIYSMVSLVLQLALAMVCMYRTFTETSSELASNTTIIFYGTNTLMGFMFLHLARKWPKLCQSIARTEAADPNVDETIIKRCNISCIVVLTLAMLEHLLSDLSGSVIAKDCQPDTNGFEAFCLQGFPWVFTYIHYNHFYGFMAQFINLQLTFTWNFSDAFIICVSGYLTARLDQINNRLNAVRGKVVHSTFWRAMREDYTRTTNLVRKVDEAINGIVFISFANNLFFICLQLLHTLDKGIKAMPACDKSLDGRPFKGYEQTVYFVYSFSFLLARSLAVSLIAARVNTASQQPAMALYDVPSSSYCIEVQRFLSQVHGDTVALSGLIFFNVKRGMVLTVAGTIVTYELVLMQFAGVTPTVAPPTAITSFVADETSPMVPVMTSAHFNYNTTSGN